MQKHIIFLRGINVSGKNKILMKDFKLLLEKNNFNHVVTYIQSGNILLESESSQKEIKNRIETLIQKKYGYEVVAFVISKNILNLFLNECPFLEEEHQKKIYFTLLSSTPSKELWDNLTDSNYGTGKITLYKNMVYLYLPDGYGTSKLNTNFIERKLKVNATARNLNTIRKMIALSE